MEQRAAKGSCVFLRVFFPEQPPRRAHFQSFTVRQVFPNGHLSLPFRAVRWSVAPTNVWSLPGQRKQNSSGLSSCGLASAQTSEWRQSHINESKSDFGLFAQPLGEKRDI